MFYFTFTLLKLIFDYKNKKNPHFLLRISCDLHLQSGDFGYEDVECLSQEAAKRFCKKKRLFCKGTPLKTSNIVENWECLSKEHS